jgi:hypothetical protein
MNMRNRYHTLLLAGILVLLATPAPAGETPLTRAEVEACLAVRERADTLRVEALARASADKPADETFEEMMTKVRQVGLEADRKACMEMGIPPERYRNHLIRLISVGELLLYQGVEAEMRIELARLESKTDADHAREADQALADTEAWHAGTGSAPAGYGDSLEEIVVQPMRDQAAAGTLDDSIRRADERRMAEIENSLAELERKLAAPALRQAVLDKPTVTAVTDRLTLQMLRGSLVE